MAEILNPAEFTAQVVQKLAGYNITVSSVKPLSLGVNYGENEPQLTLNLKSIYEEYEKALADLEKLVEPLITEVGWTLGGTRYSVADIVENALPLLRDLLREPLTEEEKTIEPGKGPLLFQQLVKRPEENVVIQYVLAKNELIRPLYTGDMLRSYPEPTEFNANCVHNLRRMVLSCGLTLSEYQVENLSSPLWLVGLRGASHRGFMASLIAVPEVMKTLQETLKATDGLVAILPARDQLLVGVNQDEVSIVEMGLLARYMKDESQQPVSSFIWLFKDGSLSRVRTIDMQEAPEEP